MSETPPTGPESPREDGNATASAGLGRVVSGGLSGESISARGVLEVIGGWRGVVEALAPATVYLVVYVLTKDARISAIAPVVIALAAIAARVVRKQPLASAISGLLGVLVCVAATLFTGQGEDFYLPGLWINAAWIAAHTISLAVGWPLLGLLLGFLRGSLGGWRSEPLLKRAVTVCTLLWIAMFAARLLVQLPLYFAAQDEVAGAVEWLGMARLVMGVPLFAVAALFTWLLLSRASLAVGKSSDE